MKESHRQILRASTIIGGASVLNILMGLVRTKVAAILLGPAGVGLIGLAQSFSQTAASVTSLGLGTVGSRAIAEADGKSDSLALAVAWQSLFRMTLICALTGATLVWIPRHWFASLVFDDPHGAHFVGLLGIGVALSIVASSQVAALIGRRRVGDIARITLASSASATIVGCAVLWHAGAAGILAFITITPLASVLFGAFFVRRQRPQIDHALPAGEVLRSARRLASLGMAVMVGGVAALLGQLAARTMIQAQLGAVALGQFQAAWYISVTYLAFVLQAMSTDFYPRLAGAYPDKALVNAIVNDQTEVALLLGTPILLGMIGASPWLMHLLYSRAFDESVRILQWQVLADVLKLAAWPMGYLLLAASDGKAFMAGELVTVVALLLTLWLGLPVLGPEAGGLAVLAMYMAYLPAIWWLARRRTGFAWSQFVRRLFLAALAATSLVLTVSRLVPLAGLLLGVALAGGAGFFALQRLGSALPGPLGRIGARFARVPADRG